MSKSFPFVIEVSKFISFKIKNNPTSSPGPFVILGRRRHNMTRGPWDEVAPSRVKESNKGREKDEAKPK